IVEPPKDFMPSWDALDYSGVALDAQLPKESVLEKPLKRVFVCSPLRGSATRTQLANADDYHATLIANIRTAQWLCYHLMLKEAHDDGYAAFAPHAFYPYFADQLSTEGSAMLEATMDIVKTCEAMYVFTKDGLENDQYISAGMRESIASAREL